MTETCPWGLASFVRVNSITETIGFQQHRYPSSAAILKEAGEQLGVTLAVSNGQQGSTWRHGPPDAPYASDSTVVRLPDGRVANIDSTMKVGTVRRQNTRMIKEHFALWLTGHVDAGRSPRLAAPELDPATAAFLERAGILPDRAARLASVVGGLDANTDQGCAIKLRYNETYGHTGSIEIIPGVTWNGKCLTVRNTTLPGTVAIAMNGAPMRSVLDHDVFEGMAVSKIILRDESFSVWPSKRSITPSPKPSRSSKGASMHSNI